MYVDLSALLMSSQASLCRRLWSNSNQSFRDDL